MNICRQEQPFVIATPKASESKHQHLDSNPRSPATTTTDTAPQTSTDANQQSEASPMDTTAVNEGASTSETSGLAELTEPVKLANGKGMTDRTGNSVYYI